MRRLVAWMLAGVAAAVSATGAMAQDYPSRPVKIVVQIAQGDQRGCAQHQYQAQHHAEPAQQFPP